jgi:chromosomal replication initiator protein
VDRVASIALREGATPEGAGGNPSATGPGSLLVLGGENAFLAAVVEHMLRAETATAWLAPRVVLFGPRGSGKSLLLQELASAWRQCGLRAACLAASETALSDEHEAELVAQPESRSARSQGTSAASMAQRVWLVDDLERLPPRTDAQQQLAAWLDERLARCEPVVLASREAPWCLTNIDARLRSRLASALCVGIRPPSPATRFTLLQRFAESAGRTLSEEAAAYLARRWSGTPGALAARLAELLARLGSAAADLRHVRRAAAALRRGSPVSLRRIAARTAAHFGQSLEAVLGKARHRQVMAARSVAMYLARHLASATLPEIGRFFGGRDHTTVLHHCRQVEQRLQTDPPLRDTVEQLTWALRPRRRRAPPRTHGG